MDTLAFDGRTGAAGDMICAALVAAGADPDVLGEIEDAVPVRIDIGTATRNGIAATTVDVVLTDAAGDRGHTHRDSDDDRDRNADNDGDHDPDDDRNPDNDRNPDDDRDHDDESDRESAEGGGAHRTYAEVVALVESMGLPAGVEDDALAVFELLGEAEAAVHGADLSDIHFHEVGADDAIADVVGACLLVDDLDVDRVIATPLATGGGEVEMNHGVYPVPTPAVVEIAERSSISLVGGPVDGELLTPTGAAILGHLADGVAALPPLRVTASGYGAGTKSFPAHPNVLRAIVGVETDGGTDAATAGRDRGAALARDDVAVLETNLDDASPEVLGGLQDTLQTAGARDVTVLPTTMKKSRPGHLVKVVCKPEDVDAVAERLARETGTLGVRETGAGHRWIADRAFETATVAVGDERFEVSVKVASTADGEIYDVSAEYDDAAAVAAESDLPIREVMRRAENAVREA